MAKHFSIVLAQRAYRDLDSIAAYISRHSPDNSAAFIDHVLSEIETLGRFPNRHPVAAESPIRGRRIRCMVVDEYRILYHVSKSEVQVIRVRHGSLSR